MTQHVHKRLVDAATDAYVAWREECAEVWDAYERWAHAPEIDAAGAFVAYRAALDREQSASRASADLLSVAVGNDAEAWGAADAREPTCRTGEKSIQGGPR